MFSWLIFLQLYQEDTFDIGQLHNNPARICAAPFVVSWDATHFQKTAVFHYSDADFLGLQMRVEETFYTQIPGMSAEALNHFIPTIGILWQYAQANLTHMRFNWPRKSLHFTECDDFGFINFQTIHPQIPREHFNEPSLNPFLLIPHGHAPRIILSFHSLGICNDQLAKICKQLFRIGLPNNPYHP